MKSFTLSLIFFLFSATFVYSSESEEDNQETIEEDTEETDQEAGNCRRITQENFAVENADLIKSFDRKWYLKCHDGYQAVLSDYTRHIGKMVEFTCKNETNNFRWRYNRIRGLKQEWLESQRSNFRADDEGQEIVISEGDDGDDGKFSGRNLEGGDGEENEDVIKFDGCKPITCPIPINLKIPSVVYYEKSNDNSRAIFSFQLKPGQFKELKENNEFDPNLGWTMIFRLEESSYIDIKTMFLYPLNSENLSFNRRFPDGFTRNKTLNQINDRTIATHFSVTSGSYNSDLTSLTKIQAGGTSLDESEEKFYDLMFSLKSDYNNLPVGINIKQVYFYNDRYINTACISDDQISNTMLKADGSKFYEQGSLGLAAYQLTSYKYAKQSKVRNTYYNSNLNYDPNLEVEATPYQDYGSDGPDFSIDLGSLPEDLANSELFSSFINGEYAQIRSSKSDEDFCLELSEESSIIAYDPISLENSNLYQMIWAPCNDLNMTEINEDPVANLNHAKRKQLFQYSPGNYTIISAIEDQNDQTQKCLTPLPISTNFHENLDPCDIWRNYPGAGTYLFLQDCVSNNGTAANYQQFGFDLETRNLISGCTHRLPISSLGKYETSGDQLSAFLGQDESIDSVEERALDFLDQDEEDLDNRSIISPRMGDLSNLLELISSSRYFG